LTDSTLASIHTQIERMRTLARSTEAQLCTRQERISAWSPAEHLDHTQKVSMSIVRRLGDKSAKPSPRGINLMGRVILLLGWIPRGRGNAPERLRGAVCTGAHIEEALGRLEQALDALPLDALSASQLPIVPHPLFRSLTPSQALRFIVVHTNHHLRIVDEILGA
jgi:hypothetical protein